MGQHARGRLGPAGRIALVGLMIDEGLTEREAAASLSVASATAHKWKQRWLLASAVQRASGVWALDRSSRPCRSPRRTRADVEARVCQARKRTGWGPRLIAGETGHAHATIWRALRRAEISRPPRTPREQPRRYEWPCPGDLLHIDSKRFVRFTRPGHAVTGDRHRTGAERRMRVGFEWVHSLVDDHSRYAYSELHRDEKAATVTGFVERGLAHFTSHGIETKRLISDNASTYTRNKALARLLASHGIRHLLIPYRRPQVNGKVCVSGSWRRPVGRRGCSLPSV
jgi:transposase